MGLCVSFCALPYSHSLPLISLFLHLSWWVLSESCQGICVCPPSPPHYSPWGGACASLTSESLPQCCSDVLRCFLKNLPGDCCQRGRCPIIPCVLLPVVMDHSQDAGLQSAVLRARGVRRRGWRRYEWLQGDERWLWGICINTTPLWVMSDEHMQGLEYTLKHTLYLIFASTNTVFSARTQCVRICLWSVAYVSGVLWSVKHNTSIKSHL